jgi:hypothetical protein
MVGGWRWCRRACPPLRTERRAKPKVGKAGGPCPPYTTSHAYWRWHTGRRCDYRVIAAARKLMRRINLTACKVIRLV